MSTFVPNIDGRVKRNSYENRNFNREVSKMNRYPLIQDVILDQQGAMFVTDDLGRMTSMRPRCQMCRYAVIDEDSWVVRCKMGVDRYAEINRKRGVREDTESFWPDNGPSRPNISEKDLLYGNQGEYTATDELIAFGSPRTPTFMSIIKKHLNNGADVDLATVKIIREIKRNHPISDDQVAQLESLIRKEAGSEDVMDLCKLEEFCEDIDPEGSRDVLRKQEKTPRLFREEVARENFTPARRWKEYSPKPVFNAWENKWEFACKRDPVEWTPPEFVMPDDPGPITVMNRCFRNEDHVICPVARGLIPRNPEEALKRLINPKDPELISFMIKTAASIPHKVLRTTRSLRVIRAVSSQFRNSGYIQHLARERGRILIERRTCPEGSSRRKEALENRRSERVPQKAVA